MKEKEICCVEVDLYPLIEKSFWMQGLEKVKEVYEVHPEYEGLKWHLRCSEFPNGTARAVIRFTKPSDFEWVPIISMAIFLGAMAWLFW